MINNERNNLIRQITILNKKLAKLDLNNELLLSGSSGSGSGLELELELKPDQVEQEVKIDLIKSRRINRSDKLQFRKPVGPLPPSLALAPKRHIALLFSYEGWAHSGLAYQPPAATNHTSPLPTVEGCLLAALEESRLIEPMASGEGFGCGFERCGRTDAGVSSSAQVVNLWVRSDLQDPMGTLVDVEGDTRGRELDPGESRRAKAPSRIEIPYVAVLNRKLPSSIRILAWSPVTPAFSSRHSCLWRHYKYFFSSSLAIPFQRPKFDFGSAYPAADDVRVEECLQSFASINWDGIELDVELMRNGLQRLVGDHDYRNFCKIDPAKQLTSHQRRVISASIDTVDGEGEDIFVLNLRGGAFLYNQVRHIVALLFLIGARRESPDIIDRLLWTSDRTTMTEAMSSLSPDSERKALDCKPSYEMADDLPLILWQCGYNSSELNWRIDNVPLLRDQPLPTLDLTPNSVVENTQKSQLADSKDTFRRQFLEMNQIWMESRLKSIILKHHLSSFVSQSPLEPSSPDKASDFSMITNRSHFTPHGAGRHSNVSNYIPLLQRPRGELPEKINQNWAEGRGASRMLKREQDKERSDATRATNLIKKADARRKESEQTLNL